MANNWNYNDFQNWFCEKFKKPNPLPWQDAMGALIDYITNEIPDNIQVVLNKLTSGASSATLTGNGTPSEPFILTINLSMVDFKGEKGDTGATGPRGPQGAGIDTLDQIELTSISSMTYDTTNGWRIVYNAVIDYGAGDTHITTATARLPIKPGDNVTIDVAEDGKSLIIKAAGGGSGLHLYYLTDGGEFIYGKFMIPIICSVDGVTSPRTLINQIWNDYGASTLYLPCSGQTSGSNSEPIYAFRMTAAEKTNGSAGIAVGTQGFQLVEYDKFEIKQVY